MSELRVTRLAGECQGGTCPTVYLSDRGTLVLQGYAVPSAEGLTLGPGEQAVELSPELVRNALAQLG